MGAKKSTMEQIKEVGDDNNVDVRLLGFFFGEVVLEAIESGKNGGDELYKECLAAPQGGLLLARTYFQTIKAGLQEAFANADASGVRFMVAFFWYCAIILVALIAPPNSRSQLTRLLSCGSRSSRTWRHRRYIV
ncbi:protein phosphatase 2C 57 isoform X2 [Senna tora]|uniref:Protein phosphatase 2C 57 isoform X2 n=1 Tax=Senna tora TaxID=362788 RepID=A0A834WI15_9FABA|nr:protein phosphatase 2C 57 isoform X2 [Senna tora]